jgi:hypothetical protein
VVALKASTNNCATTVFDSFLEAHEEYGMPSHMQGDHDGKNIDVATYMVMQNGPNCGSFLWGL